MSIIRELIQRFPYVKCTLTDSVISPYHIFIQSLYVWTGSSDKTIYPAPQYNWQYRAHHDMMHLKIGASFSLSEEIRTAQAGIVDLGLQCSPLLADVYWADTVGQQLYYYKHNKFPDDQADFVYRSLYYGREETITASEEANPCSYPQATSGTRARAGRD